MSAAAGSSIGKLRRRVGAVPVWCLVAAGCLGMAAALTLYVTLIGGFHPSTHRVTIHRTSSDGQCTDWKTDGKDPWIGNSGGPAPSSISGKLAIKTPDYAVFTWSGYPQRIDMVRHKFATIACAG